MDAPAAAAPSVLHASARTHPISTNAQTRDHANVMVAHARLRRPRRNGLQRLERLDLGPNPGPCSVYEALLPLDRGDFRWELLVPWTDKVCSLRCSPTHPLTPVFSPQPSAQRFTLALTLTLNPTLTTHSGAHPGRQDHRLFDLHR